MRALVLGLVVAATCATQGYSETIRVPADFADIQSAVDAAAVDDTIVVTSGDYTVAAPITLGAKNLHLVSEAGPESTVLSPLRGKTTEAHPVFLLSANETATIEGFTIRAAVGKQTNATLDGEPVSGTFGGAVIVESNAEPHFLANVFEGNEADFGAAILMQEDSILNLTDNHFRRHRGNVILVQEDCRIAINGGSFEDGQGGAAVRSLSDSEVVLDRVSFRNNNGEFRATVAHKGRTLTVTDCLFVGNVGLGQEPGALSIVTSEPGDIARIERSEFRSNRGEDGGAILVNADSDVLRPIHILDCVFAYNRATFGGALFVAEESDLVIVEDCRFVANSAKWNGGAIYADYDGLLDIRNSIIMANMAERGGGVAADHEAEVRLQQSVVVANSAKFGGGIAPDHYSISTHHSILWANCGGNAEGEFISEDSCGVKRIVGSGRDSIEDPGFVGWDRATLHVDASATQAGDGSIERPFRDLSEALLAFSFDLVEGSPCLDTIGAIPPGLKTTEIVDATLHPNAAVVLSPGRYQAACLALLSVRGESRESVFLEGPIRGLDYDRSLESLTVEHSLSGGIEAAPEAKFSVRDCTFRNISGVVVTTNLFSETRFENCSFEGNTGAHTVEANHSTILFDNCDFQNNLATGTSNFASNDSRFSMQNCLLAANHNRNASSTNGGSGALFYAGGPTLDLAHCTIVQNRIRNLLRCDRSSTLEFKNSLLWETGMFSFCAEDRDSLILDEPSFVRPAVIDFARTRTITIDGSAHVFPDSIVGPGDYRLTEGSAAIDAGNIAHAVPSDAKGHARPCGAGFDLGAYEFGSCTAQAFRRGDANADGALDIADAIMTLQFLFAGGVQPPCLDALDSNDDARLSISDPIRALTFLFLGGEPPSMPFDECGEDPTEDLLGCDTFSGCTI